MKNSKRGIAILSFLLFAVTLNAQQKIVAECTVTYSIETSSENKSEEALKNSSKTVYIKGNDSRVDIVSASFTQSLIYNKTTATATILREFGANKFISKLDNAKWLAENKKFDGALLNIGTETKTILGYNCKKATLTLKDGSIYELFYVTTIIPSVKEFEYIFKDVPGFVLEYDAIDANGKKIHYIANKINLSPVAVSKFDIPTSGYRIM